METEFKLSKEQREEKITDIKKRIDFLAYACKSIRMLNSAFCVLGNTTDVIIDLTSLIGTWDRDIRPEIKGIKFRFLNHKQHFFLTQQLIVVTFDELSDYELFKVYLYFEQLVPVNFNIPD